MSLQRLRKIIHKVTWDLNSTLKGHPQPSIEVLYSKPATVAGMPPEFVHRLAGPAYIEPTFGYIVTEAGRLVMEPLFTTPLFGDRPWRFGIPSPGEHFRAVRQPANILHFPAVISLRFQWEWNYFHFYFDVLGKLAMLDSLGIDPQIPIVLGKYANDVSFVRQIFQQGKFRERNWIIPDENTYIQADSILYGTGMPNDLRAKYDYILAQIQPPEPFSESEERIFLTRKTAGTRSIVNIDATEELVGRYGFRSVDTNVLSIEEQMNLFARTRFLIGIHGAGLTNMIFRQGCPLDIIELRSKTYPNDLFQGFANAYGYGWSAIDGPSMEEVAQHANFHVPLDQLESSIVQMISKSRIPSHV